MSDYQEADIHLAQELSASEYYPILAWEEIFSKIIDRPGYYLIESIIGTGKTTFIVELHKRAKQAEIPCTITLFSQIRQKSSMYNAVFSIKHQISTILNQISLKDTSLDLQNPITLCLEQGKRLILLIDGIDESERAERPLLNKLIPILSLSEKQNAGITIVFTTRPDVNDHVFNYLYDNHPLRKNMYTKFELPMFTNQDVQNILSSSSVIANIESVSNKIIQETSGFPSSVVRKIQSVQTQDFKASAPQDTKETMWRAEIRQIHQACTVLSPERQAIVREIIGFFAIAKSSLSFADLVALSETNIQIIIDITKHLSRVIYARGNEGLAPQDSSFAECVQHHPEYQALLPKLKQKYAQWVESGIQADNASLQNLSLHVLRHGAEVRATSPQLTDLLLRPAWWIELWRRTGDNITIQKAIELCWQTTVRNSNSATISVCAVNLIACALTIISFNGILPPEMVLELVAREYWQPETAAAYTIRYLSLIDRETINQGLADLGNRSVAIELFREALESLNLIPTLAQSDTHRSALVDAWVRNWERKPSILIKPGDEAEQSQVHAIQSALFASPPVVTSEADQSQSLNELITQLQRYDIDRDGSDRLVILVSNISIAWQHYSRREAECLPILSSILRPLMRYSRPDLLYVLEQLAPAIQRHFDVDVLTELKRIIELFVQTYH